MLSRVGFPLRLSVPPGKVVELAKATVAMRVATTEQDVEVLVSHSPPALTSALWFLVKICCGVSPLLLARRKKCGGMDFSTNCNG
ncbi:hypothetical protein PanWU01x14_364440 [Parasponia andersonii]|uniref:Uncharacterized protein n=1 Tax=Parasponia andersonii TaxID=3476 RepID=A0A2P5A6C8_PARAD|nr:hypothetical protein PanWU01x14_364440 [Parasponia andersonii]